MQTLLCSDEDRGGVIVVVSCCFFLPRRKAAPRALHVDCHFSLVARLQRLVSSLHVAFYIIRFKNLKT